MLHCYVQWQLLSRIPVVRPSLSQGQPKSAFSINFFMLSVLLKSTSHSNPVRQAYITSLESQISSLRDELATVYKTQGQNAQRLLAMNETLREKEELARIESEALRKAREDISHLKRKVDQHSELMTEKDRTAQVRSRTCRPI